MTDPNAVTRILNSFENEEQAASELFALVYDELHRLAQSRMRKERVEHTLQATALVNEAFVRLLGPSGNDASSWENRRHFFAAAAESMRRILIDHARAKNSAKRGGEFKAQPLTFLDLAQSYDPTDVVALDEALTSLEAEDSRAAEVVKLRFFAGLSVEETALAMDVSERTVMREWSFARARLFQLIEGESNDD